MTKGEQVAKEFREFCEKQDELRRKMQHDYSRAYIWERYRSDIGEYESREQHFPK
jgi:uncharacterized protein Yka (UPF0111/DUF47 family)